VSLTAVNPLNTPLSLTNLTLSATPSENLTIETIPEVTLEPYESRVISFSMISPVPTTIEIQSASSLFHRFLPHIQPLKRKGRRLFGTKAQRLETAYGEDQSLVVDVVTARAGIEVELEVGEEELWEGEEVEGVLRIRNNGKFGVEAVHVLSNETGVIHIKSSSGTSGFISAVVPNR
jgi:hypothetical protein